MALYRTVIDVSTGQSVSVPLTAEEVAEATAAAAAASGVTPDMVKTEAQRRVYERFPQWKQSNMTARAVELIRIGESNWSDDLHDEVAALDAAWAWIKSVRDACNAIESMEPIPTDYCSDSKWP